MSADDHRRTSTVLQRVMLSLQDVAQTVRRHYPRTHATHKGCGDSIERVQALRLQMENAARSEHPGENLVYLTNAVRISSEALSHALATSGEDIELD